jgi:hypothetical protein
MPRWYSYGRRSKKKGVAALRGERAREPLHGPDLVRVVPLELAVFPQGVERAAELLDDAARLGLARLQVPLEPIREGGRRDVGRADVHGAEPRRTMEEPRLRVQPGAPRVERYPYLGSGQPGDGVERLAVGRAQVRGREHPKPLASPREHLERVPESSPAVPLDEGHEHVDGVSALDLRRDLRAEARLVPRVGEERRDGQRHRRPRWRRGRAVDRQKDRGRDEETRPVEPRWVHLRPEHVEQLVHEPGLLVGAAFLR